MLPSLVLATTVLVPFSFTFVKWFAHRPSVSTDILLLLSLSFFLGFFGSVLLPIDLSQTVIITTNSTNTTAEAGARAVTEACEVPCEIAIHGYIQYWTNLLKTIFARSLLSCFVENAPRLARRSNSTIQWGHSLDLALLLLVNIHSLVDHSPYHSHIHNVGLPHRHSSREWCIATKHQVLLGLGEFINSCWSVATTCSQQHLTRKKPICLPRSLPSSSF